MNDDPPESRRVRPLGKTGIRITSIGQGTMQFWGGSLLGNLMFPSITEDESNAIVKTAHDTGMNWFDTAEAYGFGRSERRLSAGLQAAKIQDSEVVIATKWMPIMRWAGSITRTIDTRLERLHPYTIDLHQIHMPYSLSSLSAQVNAMADLVEEGKIRAIGVSNFSEKRMRKADALLEDRGLPLAANQVSYSLLNRQIERNGVLDAAKELGITIIAWGPLSRGVLTGKYHHDSDLLKRLPLGRRLSIRRKLDPSRAVVGELASIAQNHEATISQIALSWLVTYHGDTVVAIPGASNSAQVEQNGHAMGLTLSRNELNSIADLSEPFLAS